MSRLTKMGGGPGAGQISAKIASEANLLGYWPLDTRFTFTDQSGVGNNGTGSGGVATTGDGPGGFTSSTVFDGTDDCVTAALNCYVASSTRTFELWTWRASAATGYRAMIGSQSATATLCVGFYTTGTGGNVEWYGQNGSPPAAWTAAMTATDTWYHVMLTHNDTALTAKLFVNGSSLGQVATSSFNAGAGNFEIGGYKGTPPNPDCYQGRIAHVAVYSGDQTALAPAHYALGVGG